MDKRDKQIKSLQQEVFLQSIFIETLVELLYEMEVIEKSTFSTKIEDKVKLYKQVKKSSKKKEDPENPMFYGPHGEA